MTDHNYVHVWVDEVRLKTRPTYMQPKQPQEGRLLYLCTMGFS